jgi:hypothetical protein
MLRALPLPPLHPPRPLSRLRSPGRRRRSLRFAPWLLLASCTAPTAVAAHVGYARLAVDGDLALGSDGNGGGGSAAQDVGAAFGLGSELDSPYVRATADFGLPELIASGFWIRESGDGVLDSSFGGLPAGTPVSTSLELGHLKLAGALGYTLGPVTVAPGLLLDVFAIDFRASSSPGNREEVDEVIGVPMPFVRVAAPVFGLAATIEAAYLELPGFVDGDGRFADVEALLEWRGESLQFAAGYRLLTADAEGDSGADTVAIDLRVSGWFVGGGLRF